MSRAAALGIRLGAFMSMMALCLIPAFAQDYSQPPTGRIHGRVISPTGQPQNGGSVSLSTDGGQTMTYTFPVSAAGEFAGEASIGEYTLLYRAANMPEGKVADYIQGVVILAGKDVRQDIDMTRQEYMDRLTPEQQQQIQKMRAASAAATAASSMAGSVNADLDVVNRDLQDAEKARVSALEILGKEATQQDVDAKAADIENAKYSEIQTLMTKDTASDPNEPIVWIDLARAQSGLKDYLDAETSFKKALDLETKEAKPEPQVLGAIEGGLGEVYARTLMVDEANAAFDAAAKADPVNAALYLENQAIIFFQAKNAPAQVDAANRAIKADPNNAFLYYIKAQGLAQDAPFDPNSDKSILSPECIAAFHKYLELAPDGPFAAEVNTALERSEAKPGSPTTPPAGPPTSAPANSPAAPPTN